MRCSCSLRVGHLPRRLGAPREAVHPWGDAEGDWREELLSGEQGCPSLLPPSSTANVQAGCPAHGGGDGAVEGCRGRRVGIKTSVRRPGRRSL